MSATSHTDSYQNQYDFLTMDAVKKWRAITANDGALLEQEFNALRKLDINRINVAKDPINKSKNRYALVYPYDEDFCRVSLKKEFNEKYQTNSNYINASLIRSVPPGLLTDSSTRTFYAAQGPTEHTLNDFLRMIVEQEIDVIVMLSCAYDPITCTYAQEHVPYFSDNRNTPIETNCFKIRTIRTGPSYRYAGRRLRIRSKLTNDIHWCEHYHYSDFIDKSIPTDCHSMIRLVMRLREQRNQNCRMLVHCSAGIGRTGVFLALYYLIDTFSSHSVLNVKQLVDNMRLYRPFLVQTAEQYEFIYRCLAVVCLHPCDGRTLSEFIEHAESRLPKANSPHSTIYQDFQSRNERIELDSSITSIMARQYRDSNRHEKFIPYDYNRVILHSPSESMYINASRVTNVIRSTGTILTQEPTESSLQPFFAMLLQEHKTFIVAVEQMEKVNYTEIEFTGAKEISAHRLPVDGSRNKFGNYYQSHKINVKHSNRRESNVFVFEYTGEWKNDRIYLPVNLEQFVRFVDRSIYHQQKLDPNRLGLVVHDRTGGPKAAFYCIVQNLFDRLLIDGRVAIENFTTDICQQRMNAIVSLEQYLALYESVSIWSTLKHRGALECTVKYDQI